MSAVCAFNCLVNAFAALMRANKPETVSIVLILTVCSSHLCTCVDILTGQVQHLDQPSIRKVYIGVGLNQGYIYVFVAPHFIPFFR